MFFHIFHYKFISFFKTAFDKRAVSIVRGVASSLVFCGFAYGAYYICVFMQHALCLNILTQVYICIHTFISMLLFVLFIAVNLGNIIVSYSTLYRSSEVSFLLTKPVSFTTIFILKFFDNFFYSSTTLFVVAFMALFGYGSYFGYPWYFFAGVMVFVMIPFMFLSACLAVLILMAIMKLAGRIGFRKVMAGLFALYFFFIYLFFNSSNPITLVEKAQSFLSKYRCLSFARGSGLSSVPSKSMGGTIFLLCCTRRGNKSIAVCRYSSFSHYCGIWSVRLLWQIDFITEAG